MDIKFVDNKDVVRVSADLRAARRQPGEQGDKRLASL
jgi:hypothetical protein